MKSTPPPAWPAFFKTQDYPNGEVDIYLYAGIPDIVEQLIDHLGVVQKQEGGRYSFGKEQYDTLVAACMACWQTYKQHTNRRR